MKRWLVIALASLIGCATPETSRQANVGLLSLPDMKTFAPSTPQPPRLSNAQIARDFLDLTFRLERNANLTFFTRFEGPVTVRVAGKALPTLNRDLERLVARLRREAGIDISIISSGPASITIQSLPQREILRAAPSAACFVVPNVSSWSEYRSKRRDRSTSWQSLTERKRMAVFLPSDDSPQEIRDCLHEEIAQALGPVNDLYRLQQSVFNDDNFNTVLTGYDMLILKAYYDDALSNGMLRSEVALRLPEILNRLNPRGGYQDIANPAFESIAWKNAIKRATDTNVSKSGRANAAKKAVSLARSAGDTGARLAFSLYLLGRTTMGSEPEQALNAFVAADRIYRAEPNSDIQRAHVALHIAAFQLSAGDLDGVKSLTDRQIPVVTRGEHAALLSLFLLIRAEAFAALGDAEKSATIQREALAWARYGFGSQSEIRARMAEIRAISAGGKRVEGNT